MKRSEMVKVIELALKRWNGAYYDESLESYILSELEERGMLPPCYIAQEAYMEFECFDWEPEDG